MDRFSDTSVFVAVVDSGSFTRAADQLELSKAAVSKYVGRLEQRLGARLLQRTTRRLSLTEAGELLYRRSAQALAELGAAEHDVSQLTGAPRGLLRVTAPVYFGSVRLAPLVKDFRVRFPDIELDIDLSDRRVDLVRERYDVAIRIADTLGEGLVARKLAPCPLVIVASPAYARRHGMPATPADLRTHECLSYSIVSRPNEWRLRAPKGRWIAVSLKSSIRCNSDFVLKQAALDGLGLGMFPDFFVEQEVAERRLLRVLPDHEAPAASLFAVYASRRQLLPKVRAFVDFMAERTKPTRLR